MTDISPRLESGVNCGVCGKPLVYASQSASRTCYFCRQTSLSPICCPDGHYICDVCHQGEAIEALRQVLKSFASPRPGEILERAMMHPRVPMHGPEHHAIVPAVLVAAAGASGYPLPENAIETAIERGAKAPGGWCGYCGACGAAIGAGIAVSVLSGGTPLKGKPRTLALEATSRALAGMLDGFPRCCKRASRTAVASAIDFMRDRMGIYLEASRPGECLFPDRNRECPRSGCKYYGD